VRRLEFARESARGAATQDGSPDVAKPEFTSLGEGFKEFDSVVIAKMDATANEIDEVEVEGFPTLYFYKAGSKEPVKYEGGRTASEMSTYIKENVGIPLKGSTDKSEL